MSQLPPQETFYPAEMYKMKQYRDYFNRNKQVRRADRSRGGRGR